MRLLISFLLLLVTQVATASQLNVFVSVKCSLKRVEVKFERAWNEDRKSMNSEKTFNRWNTEDLRTITSSDDVHYKTETVPKSVSCQISGSKIRVVVHPQFAPGWHPVGHCAARTGARVEIYRDRKLLIEDGLDACTEVGDVPVVIDVLARGKPIVVRMNAQEFIYGS